MRSVIGRVSDDQAPRSDAWGSSAAGPGVAGVDEGSVVGRAYAEFVRRRDAGEQVEIDEFCDCYPEYQSSLRRVLTADALFHACPELLDDLISPAPQWPGVGDVLGDLTLQFELGRGSFSRVFLARERSMGNRQVAVKMSTFEGEEANLLGPIHHDNIVPVHWARHDPQRRLHLVCMPYLGRATLTHVQDQVYRGGHEQAGRRSGRTIHDAVLRSTPPPLMPDHYLSAEPLRGKTYSQAVASLGEQLAAALAFLHGRRTAHCDLKPSNVLVTPGGRPLLLDFNLSRSAEAVEARLGGTVAYMAPEAIEAWLANKPLSPEGNAGADLYALGTVLFELLTGRHPLGSPKIGTPEQVAAWALQAQRDRPQGVLAAVPDVPRGLADLVESCLAASPLARPASAAELSAALKKLVATHPGRRSRVAVALLMLPFAAGVPLVGQPTERAAVRNADDESSRGRENLVRGWQAQQKGRRKAATAALVLAERELGRAIELRSRELAPRPFDGEEHYVRGRVLMLLGDDAQALSSFGRVAEELRLRDGKALQMRIDACRAYCHALQGHIDTAKYLTESALSAGLDTPGLRNNLAACLLRGGLFAQGNADQALKCQRLLEQALSARPDLRPALLNRLAFLWRKWLQAEAKGLQDGPTLDHLVGAVDAVLPRGVAQRPPTPCWVYPVALRLLAEDMAERARLGATEKELRDRRERLDELVRECWAAGANRPTGPPLPELEAAVARAWPKAGKQPAPRDQKGGGIALADPLTGPLR